MLTVLVSTLSDGTSTTSITPNVALQPNTLSAVGFKTTIASESSLPIECVGDDIVTVQPVPVLHYVEVH